MALVCCRRSSFDRNKRNSGTVHFSMRADGLSRQTEEHKSARWVLQKFLSQNALLLHQETTCNHLFQILKLSKNAEKRPVTTLRSNIFVVIVSMVESAYIFSSNHFYASKSVFSYFSTTRLKPWQHDFQKILSKEWRDGLAHWYRVKPFWMKGKKVSSLKSS